MKPKFKPETDALLKLTEKSYDEYNAILPVIKARLGYERAQIFNQVVGEELPFTTARRAYRTAIKVAMDEKTGIFREFIANKKNEKTEK